MLLSPAILAVLAATVIATSFISGIFGMAGGLILLGVLLMVLDVGPAMILFGATQAASNGWRAALWWRHVQWGLVWRFLLGSTAVFFALRLVALYPDKAWVYIGLGLSPFIADVVPKQLTPDITRPGAPYICGAIVMLMTLLAGVAGPVLDVFYQKSALDRRQVVCDKGRHADDGASLSHHLLRIVYGGARRRHSVRGVRRRYRLRGSRHDACGACARRYVQRRLSSLEPARHRGCQPRLSRPRPLAAGARITAVDFYRPLTKAAQHSTQSVSGVCDAYLNWRDRIAVSETGRRLFVTRRRRL